MAEATVILSTWWQLKMRKRHHLPTNLAKNARGKSVALSLAHAGSGRATGASARNIISWNIKRENQSRNRTRKRPQKVSRFPLSVPSAASCSHRDFFIHFGRTRKKRSLKRLLSRFSLDPKASTGSWNDCSDACLPRSPFAESMKSADL